MKLFWSKQPFIHMFQSGHVAAARCLLAASPPLHTILKKKVKSTNIYKITFFKIAHSCKWFRSAADSCSHLQPLAATRRHLPHVAAATGCKWLQEQAASGCKWLLFRKSKWCTFARFLQSWKKGKSTNTLFFLLKMAHSCKWLRFAADSCSHLAATWQPLAQAATWQPLGSLLAATWQPLGSHLAATCSHLLRQPLGSDSQTLALSGCSKWLPSGCQVAASGWHFENHNDARLLAFCNLEKKENLQTHFFFLLKMAHSCKWLRFAADSCSHLAATCSGSHLAATCSHLLRQPLGSHSQTLALSGCSKWLPSGCLSK